MKCFYLDCDMHDEEGNCDCSDKPYENPCYKAHLEYDKETKTYGWVNDDEEDYNYDY